MTKCKSWRRYKGRFKPRCDNGKGCGYCNSLYEMLKGSNNLLNAIQRKRDLETIEMVNDSK